MYTIPLCYIRKPEVQFKQIPMLHTLLSEECRSQVVTKMTFESLIKNNWEKIKNI